MTAIVVQGNAMALPLPDECVDLVVTSPPYFGLRSYTDDGRPVPDQVGGEATPHAFIDALIAATAEMVRVLKPSGSIFVNLGDKYAAKSLMLLPERYRIAAVDRLGLIARAVIVWDKPNGLPESVRDRVRRSHEDWVHLTKMPRYFSAIDEIREAYAPETAARYLSGYRQESVSAAGQTANGVLRRDDGGPSGTNPLGKLPGSVWRIPTAPLRLPPELGVDHFAAFPPAWPKRIIQGWSPAGVCVECGEGRRPVVQTNINGKSVVPNLAESIVLGIQNKGGAPAATWGVRAKDIDRVITGYACACAEPTAGTRPAVVLDPFGGTGTTATVAHALGRVGISGDLSHDYSRVAQWRTADEKQLAKVTCTKPPKRAKVPACVDGQMTLA